MSTSQADDFAGVAFLLGVAVTILVVWFLPIQHEVKFYEWQYADDVCAANQGKERVRPGGAFIYDTRVTCNNGAVFKANRNPLRQKYGN
jgi:hypothetical protein